MARVETTTSQEQADMDEVSRLAAEGKKVTDPEQKRRLRRDPGCGSDGGQVDFHAEASQGGEHEPAPSPRRPPRSAAKRRAFSCAGSASKARGQPSASRAASAGSSGAGSNSRSRSCCLSGAVGRGCDRGGSQVEDPRMGQGDEVGVDGEGPAPASSAVARRTTRPRPWGRSTAPPSEQRCAAARTIRRDDSEAGTVEAVSDVGEVSVAEGVAGRTARAVPLVDFLSQPGSDGRRRDFRPLREIMCARAGVESRRLIRSALGGLCGVDARKAHAGSGCLKLVHGSSLRARSNVRCLPGEVAEAQLEVAIAARITRMAATKTSENRRTSRPRDLGA